MKIILTDEYTDLEQNIKDNTNKFLNSIDVIVTGRWLVDNITEKWAERIEPTKEALDALIAKLLKKDEFELYCVRIGHKDINYVRWLNEA
tara:strand:- start:1706 stop:1975 length:270 start_codon:yes stop_codon:yes gene_type:complete